MRTPTRLLQIVSIALAGCSADTSAVGFPPEPPVMPLTAADAGPEAQPDPPDADPDDAPDAAADDAPVALPDDAPDPVDAADPDVLTPPDVEGPDAGPDASDAARDVHPDAAPVDVVHADAAPEAAPDAVHPDAAPDAPADAVAADARTCFTAPDNTPCTLYGGAVTSWCLSGVCYPCGGDTQACCQGARACVTGACAPNAAGLMRCASCGVAGLRCCEWSDGVQWASQRCDAGLVCSTPPGVAGGYCHP